MSAEIYAEKFGPYQAIASEIDKLLPNVDAIPLKENSYAFKQRGVLKKHYQFLEHLTKLHTAHRVCGDITYEENIEEVEDLITVLTSFKELLDAFVNLVKEWPESTPSLSA
jgi:hypothetical protein